MVKSKSKREQMVRWIKSHYGLDSPEVLLAMLQVPRHKFVGKKNKVVAYDDKPIDIGFGQTMSQPYTVAMMTHLLINSKIKNQKSKGPDKGLKRWKVLEIGTGSGYQAAILSKLVGEVYSLEVIPELAERARKTIYNLRIKNVQVRQGSGEWGWPEKSPLPAQAGFDAIIITAGVEKVPQVLFDQLKVGGVLVAPVGPRWSQTMTRLTKKREGSLKKEEFEKYVFVPFIEEGS